MTARRGMQEENQHKMQTIDGGGWPGNGPVPSPNMAYVPRSRPAFPGDLQHDFRDFQLDHRRDTLAQWSGRAAGHYLRAAALLGVAGTDPIADCLQAEDRLDARTLWVAHDRMAAVWRRSALPGVLSGNLTMLETDSGRGVISSSPAGLMVLFRRWLEVETDSWARYRPPLLRLFLRAMLGEHSRSGQALEAELYFALAHLHPLPGETLPPPTPGLFAAGHA